MSTQLVALAAELSAAKRAEKEAEAARIAVEERIIKATGFAKAKGQETFDEEGPNGHVKLTLKQPLNVKVDGEAWRKLRRTLDPKHPARDIFVAKYELKGKAATALQKEQPQAWAQVCSVVTTTPGKVSVEVKTLELAGRE